MGANDKKTEDHNRKKGKDRIAKKQEINFKCNPQKK